MRTIKILERVNGEWVEVEYTPTAEEIARMEREEAEAAAQAKQREADALKEELAATDYKVIKCSEAQLSGQPMPYDVAELHAERQRLRDRINEIEGN